MSVVEKGRKVGLSISGYFRKLARSPAWTYLKRDERAWIGFALVILVVGTAIFADFIAPYGINDRLIEEAPFARPPGGAFILGTDSQGRDVFSRVIQGTRIALEIGLLLVALEAVIGVPLGLMAGYYGGKVDELVMRAVDVALSFPGLVLAAAFIGFFGSGLNNLIIALSLTGWAAFARITRAQALTIKEQPYVESARAIGEKDRTIISKYILPNGISPLIVIATMTLPAAILLASALNFMGLGVQEPTPAWGAMLTGARSEVLDGIWWTALFPGVAIIITVLGFNFLGDALRDALDPRLREYKYV